MCTSDWDFAFRRLATAMLLLAIALVATSCLPEEDLPEGTINGKRTPTVVSVLSTIRTGDGYLTIEGEITSVGKGTQIYEKGFFVSLSSSDPGSADSIIRVSTSGNRFSADIFMLSGDTTLYWRAYAINDFGIDLGDVKVAKTPPIIEAADDFRSQLRLRFASFALGNSFFIVCGETNHGALSELWEYSISDNKWWGNLPAFPGGQRRYPIAFAIGNKAFVGTGQKTFSEIYNDFYVFDGATRTWSDTVVTSIPGERYNAATFTLGDTAYVVGGSSFSNYLNEVWQMTDSSGVYVWHRMNNFPVEIFGGITVINGRDIYAGFGENMESYDALWKYDPTDDSWEKFCEIPSDVTTGFYDGAAVGQYIYFVDGENNIWQLNTNDRSWRLKRPLPDTFFDDDSEAAEQNIFCLSGAKTLYIGIGFTELFYIYRPLWDN
jgi:hypothetical protein